mgnify:CR=1 FL=1
MKKENKPKDSLPLLPLRDMVVFPFMTVPLVVGREKSIAAVEESLSKDKTILLCAQKSVKVEEPSEDDIYPIGTVSQVIQSVKLPDGSYKQIGRASCRERVCYVV